MKYINKFLDSALCHKLEKNLRISWLVFWGRNANFVKKLYLDMDFKLIFSQQPQNMLDKDFL